MPYSQNQSSSSSLIPRLTNRRPAPPLLVRTSPSVMQAKSRPTCTLSLANVSACKSAPDAMLVDSVVTVSFVAVPVSPVHPKGNRLFSDAPRSPTSAQTTTPPVLSQCSSSPSRLSRPHALLRSTALPLFVNKAFSRFSGASKATDASIESEKEEGSRLKHHEAPLPEASALPPRKRARKGSLSAAENSSLTASCEASPKSHSLIEPDLPPRPSSPTPDSRPLHEPCDVAKPACPPPYIPSPPPYTPDPLPLPPTTPVIHAPRPVPAPKVPILPSVPKSSPSAPSAPSTPNTPRRYRLAPSEAKLLSSLYRTLVVGLERRKHLEESRASLATSGFLDDMLVDSTSTDALEAYFNAEEDEDEVDSGLEEEKNKVREALDVQDAMLALRLREFLVDACGVDESLLAVEFDESERHGKANPDVESPFLENGKDAGKMDVDVRQSKPSFSSEPTTPSPLPRRFSSPPPLTSSSSTSDRRKAPSPTHLVAVFTIRSRGRAKHHSRSKPGRKVSSPLRNEVQLRAGNPSPSN